MSSIYDPQLVKSYHEEYLGLIKYYMNAKRSSSFIRYYNVDRDKSVFDDKLEASYDIYHNSGIRFNIYDFTPSYYLAPIVNASSNVQDLRGQMMDAQTSIVTYTIEKPQIHDLIMFYGPVASGEIFRVSNFRTAVNAIHSDPQLHWFELELEYAPIINPGILKLSNHFVYDLSLEKYLTYENYQKFIKKIKDVEIIFEEIKHFYNPYYDLYEVDHLVPIEVNETLLHFKNKFDQKFRRLFEKFYTPYGYFDYCLNELKYPEIENLPYKEGNYIYSLYNLENNKMQDYTWAINYTEQKNNLDKLFHLSHVLYKEFFDWD